MANVQSIVYNTETNNYDITLSAETTEVTYFNFNGFDNTWTFSDDVTIGYAPAEPLTDAFSKEQIIVPAGVSTFSTTVGVESAVYSFVIDEVNASDIIIPSEIDTVAYNQSTSTFTVTLTTPLEYDKLITYRISSNPIGAAIYDLSSNVVFYTSPSLTPEYKYNVGEFGVPLRSAAAAAGVGSIGNYIRIPQGEISFGIRIYYPIINLDRDVTLTLAGTDYTETVTGAVAYNTPATLTTVNAGAGDTESVAIAYDYSDQINAIVSAINNMSENTANTIISLSNVANKMVEVSNSIEQQTKSINAQSAVIQALLSSSGVPIRDVYGSLSYSTLIKVLEEEDVDINELIARTRVYLESLYPTENN
jgi:hypothetical protein